MTTEDGPLAFVEGAESQTESQIELQKQITEDQALDPLLLEVLPRSNDIGEYDIAEVSSCAEALLFTTDKPISLRTLREQLSPPGESPLKLIDALKEALKALKARYGHESFAFELVEVGGGYQFRTKPRFAPILRRLAKVRLQRLSRGAMETLAIVAYRQPVLKEDIDRIRGVDSSYFIRILLDRRLLSMGGRSELPGRPILYETTPEFLQLFGLKDLASMPPLSEIEKLVPMSEAGHGDEEDPRIAKIRNLVGEMRLQGGPADYDPCEDSKILDEFRERIKALPVSTPTLEAMAQPAPEPVV